MTISSMDHVIFLALVLALAVLYYLKPFQRVKLLGTVLSATTAILLLSCAWQDMATSLIAKRLLPASFSSSSTVLTCIKPAALSFHPKSLHQSFNQAVKPHLQLLAPFTTSAPSRMASQQFLDLVKSRRTIYGLKNESPIPDKQIQDIVEQAILHVPSSFNSQSTRVVLLFKNEHEKLWEFVREGLKAIVPAEQFSATEQKINAFKAGYGTVLFFNSRSVVAGMQDKFAAYADKFPGWASQSNGMTQFTIWTALEAEGLGANLQHYNPIIDAKVSAEWNIPEDWELNAQLVFGTPLAPAGEKTFQPLEERFKVFGA